MSIVLFALWYAVGWCILLGDWYLTFRKNQFYPWHDGFPYLGAVFVGVLGPFNLFVVGVARLLTWTARK